MGLDFSNNAGFDFDLDSSLDEKYDEPKQYKVILLNDHYTTMEFVVLVLMQIFHKNQVDATQIMLDVHKKGQGLCGIYTYDIAVTKVAQVAHLAKQNNFPLKCIYEEE